jgi:hypothetical protein
LQKFRSHEKREFRSPEIRSLDHFPAVRRSLEIKIFLNNLFVAIRVAFIQRDQCFIETEDNHSLTALDRARLLLKRIAEKGFE